MKLARVLLTMVFVVCFSAQFFPAAAGEQVTVVGWGGNWNKAYEKGVWKPYMKQTGVKIIQEEWMGEVAKIRAQVQAGNIIYDMVSVEAPGAEIGCAEGLFVKLPRSVTGDPDKYLPETIHECGVASDTWADVMVYNADFIKGKIPKSWADFWDVKKFPGKRQLYGQAQFTFENALLADGVPVSEVYKVLRSPGGVDRVFKVLDRIRPHVIWWNQTTQAMQNLASGEVVMSDGFNARITHEIEAEKKNYVILWEAGYFYGTDLWVVVNGAPNMKAALDLLTWFSEPKNQAGFSNNFAYGTGRVEAINYVSETKRAQLPTAPQNIKYGAPYDIEYWVENKEALEKRFKTWLSK